MKNHYRTLGIPNFSTPKEVQIAFRALAVKYHPDKHQGSTIYENKFKIVNEAYQVLSDASAKNIYDQQLSYYLSPKLAQTPSKRNTSRTSNPSSEYKNPTKEEAAYTKFQKQYIPYAYKIPIVFLVIIVLGNIFSKTESAIDTFEARSKALVTDAQLSIDRNEFEKAENEIVLVYSIESNSYMFDYLVEQFCKKTQEKAVDYYERKDYANCLKTLVLHERMSLNIASPSVHKYTNYLMIIESGIETNKKSIVDEYFDGLYAMNITDYTRSFHLVDVMLENGWTEKSALFSKYLMNNYINFMLNRYGLMYKEMMTDKQLSVDFKKQVAQYVYLNYSSAIVEEDKTNLEVMKDLLKEQLVGEEEKKVYYELLFVDFDRHKFSTKLKSLKTSEKEYLKNINLYEYYSVLK